jgi:hypothetical protein
MDMLGGIPIGRPGIPEGGNPFPGNPQEIYATSGPEK